MSLTGLAGRLRDTAINVLLIAVIVFTFGALGGIGIWLGGQLFDANDQIEGGDSLGLSGDAGEEIDHVIDATISVRNLGGFVDTLGTLTDLIIVGLAAFGGALWLASVGATLAAGPLRHVYSPLSNILGGVLGFASGAILAGRHSVYRRSGGAVPRADAVGRRRVGRTGRRSALPTADGRGQTEA